MDGGVVEGDDRALRDGAQLAEHVDELLLQAGIERRQLLDLDHEADLADRELDHLLQEGNLLPVAGVELAQLGRGVVADEPNAVGRPIQRVVVDHDQPSVRRQVDVALDEVAAGRDRGAKRPHRVLRVLGGVAPVPAQQGPAVVVCTLVARANRLSQDARSV